MFNWITKEQIKELQKIELFKNLDNIQIQQGWFNVIKEMGESLTFFCKKNNIEFPQINQIKTKFGTLRFYYSHISNNKDLINKFDDLVSEFTIKINDTCEKCGSNNNVINVISNNIVNSLCIDHRTNSDVLFNDFVNIQI